MPVASKKKSYNRRAGNKKRNAPAKRAPVASFATLFNELPVELVYEIFGWLTPLCLLRLANTSKTFRSLLMTRAAKGVWVSARWAFSPALGGLPPLGEMNEPQWASFCFDITCTRCNRSRLETYVDLKRMNRICQTCLSGCSDFTPASDDVDPDSDIYYVDLELFKMGQEDEIDSAWDEEGDVTPEGAIILAELHAHLEVVNNNVYMPFEHAPRANLGYGPVFHEDDAIGLINAARLGESDEEAVAFISSQRELKRVLIALGNHYRFVEHLCTDIIKVALNHHDNLSHYQFNPDFHILTHNPEDVNFLLTI